MPVLLEGMERDGRCVMAVSRAEIEKAFREAVKAHNCPACGAAFTDYAVDWGWGWFHGYRDRLAEEGITMRDGPFKIECEACGRRSWYHVFGNRVALVEAGDNEG